MKVRFSEQANQLIVKEVHHYSELQERQCLDIFLDKSYEIVDETEPADICIVGIQHTDNSLLRDNEINILLCVENLSIGRKHYKHFNNFGRNNPKINHYIYNDVSEPADDITPAVLCRMRYFNTLTAIHTIPFNKKRFCLFMSRNGLNANKQDCIQRLSQYGEIEFIDKYNISHLTCYNDPELLRIFNLYKFVICFENSKTDGYITEKIFNVFLAKSIPIYDGAPNVCSFINKHAFIQYPNINIESINETNYNYMIDLPKCADITYV